MIMNQIKMMVDSKQYVGIVHKRNWINGQLMTHEQIQV